MAKKKKKHVHTKNCTDVHHHQHVRKRLDIFQASFVDRLVYIAGPLIPIAIVPTAYAVWVNDKVDGIALPTWIILTFTSLSMSLYAVVHREKALILTYIPLAILNGSVVVGVLLKT